MQGATRILFGLASVAWAVASCADPGPAYPVGPGGTYAVDLHCTPYSSGDGPASFCEGEQYLHYFQCNEQPGEACEEAPRPSADPNQVAYCCEFPCIRYEASDQRCTGGTRAYACDQDDAEVAADIGCDDGPDPNLVCC